MSRNNMWSMNSCECEHGGSGGNSGQVCGHILFEGGTDGMCTKGPSFAEFVELAKDPRNLMCSYAYIVDESGDEYNLAPLVRWYGVTEWNSQTLDLETAPYIEIIFQGVYRYSFTLTPDGYILGVPGSE